MVQGAPSLQISIRVFRNIFALRSAVALLLLFLSGHISLAFESRIYLNKGWNFSSPSIPVTNLQNIQLHSGAPLLWLYDSNSQNYKFYTPFEQISNNLLGQGYTKASTCPLNSGLIIYASEATTVLVTGTEATPSSVTVENPGSQKWILAGNSMSNLDLCQQDLRSIEKLFVQRQIFTDLMQTPCPRILERGSAFFIKTKAPFAISWNKSKFDPDLGIQLNLASLWLSNEEQSQLITRQLEPDAQQASVRINSNLDSIYKMGARSLLVNFLDPWTAHLACPDSDLGWSKSSSASSFCSATAQLLRTHNYEIALDFRSISTAAKREQAKFNSTVSSFPSTSNWVNYAQKMINLFQPKRILVQTNLATQLCTDTQILCLIEDETGKEATFETIAGRSTPNPFNYDVSLQPRRELSWASLFLLNSSSMQDALGAIPLIYTSSRQVYLSMENLQGLDSQNYLSNLLNLDLNRLHKIAASIPITTDKPTIRFKLNTKLQFPVQEDVYEQAYNLKNFWGSQSGYLNTTATVSDLLVASVHGFESSVQNLFSTASPDHLFLDHRSTQDSITASVDFVQEQELQSVGPYSLTTCSPWACAQEQKCLQLSPPPSYSQVYSSGNSNLTLKKDTTHLWLTAKLPPCAYPLLQRAVSTPVQLPVSSELAYFSNRSILFTPITSSVQDLRVRTHHQSNQRAIYFASSNNFLGETRVLTGTAQSRLKLPASSEPALWSFLDNATPSVSVGSDFQSSGLASINIAAVASDADEDSLLYSWKQLSGTPLTMAQTNQSTLMIEAPGRTSQDETYSLQVQVSDGKASAFDELTISVQRNFPPQVQLTLPLQVTGSQTFSPAAIASDDNQDPLSFLWNQVSGPSAQISDLQVLTPSITAPVKSSELQRLEFSLSVSDGTTTVTLNKEVFVSANGKPSIFVDPQEIVVNARAPGSLLASASDPDNDPVSIVWRQILEAGDPVVELDTSTPTRVRFTAPDVSEDTLLKFGVLATDGTSSSDEKTIRVGVPAVPSQCFSLGSIDICN